ncbi:hypothetical protein [uncultured Kordia sp.]|uniref:TPM domain-containing protein n=1 Tax=uncultured Kordia sp. TaxID=507699 RepID=UPI0026029647|nr:hypothetical protein [uncultured Kordia sp.]
MNWKLKYTVFKIKVLQKIQYFIYKLKSAVGIKKIGFKKFDSLVIMELLNQYKPDLFTMNVVSIQDNLDTANLEVIHDQGIRLDKSDYLSIILNLKKRQVRIVKGKNLNKYIDDSMESEIVKEMQSKITTGEIIFGLHLGMKRIQKCLAKQK